MAEKEQGNLTQPVSVARAGMDMDHFPGMVQPGWVTYALNANVENYDANSVSYSNEEGNIHCLTFPEGFFLVGKHFISEKNKHIFFLATPERNQSQIGYMDNTDCLYHTLVESECLNFSIQHPIHKVVHKITNCSTEIYWTDGLNPRRHMDIDSPPRLLSPGSDLCDPSYTNILDCNQLKIQPNFLIPQLGVNKILAGGTLVTGVYQFAIQYADASGNPYTSYYSVTNPTPIFDDSVVSVNFNTPVGKSIALYIENLDVTGQFEYYNLAVIKTVNAITSVELVGTYFIENTTDSVVYTGQAKDSVRLSINDIFEKHPYYDIAQDVTAVQDVLVWDGLTSIDRINYQSVASKLHLQWESWRIPSTENYANEENATNLRGYLRDEIYPFEIVFLLKNGRQTDGFHIPGRVANSNDLSVIQKAGNDDFTIDGTSAPKWKIYNTATKNNEFLGSEDSLYKGPWQYGEFAYWESEDEYPCNTELWGELAGQKIRHHKFPDVAISPVQQSAPFSSIEALQMGNTAIYPLGVKLNQYDVKIAIDQSTLSAVQKAEIVGYKIVRGDRTNTKSIVAKGILRNVGEYEREEETYLYPNYPYNDLTEDPFLNAQNNAFQDSCSTYTIALSSLVGGAATITYQDCGTDEEKTMQVSSLLRFDLCSSVKPVIESPAKGTVGLADYDIYYVASESKVGGKGWTVEWLDPMLGIQREWLDGPLGDERSETVHVVVGTTPTCTEATGNSCDVKGKKIEKTGEYRSSLICGSTETPLVPTNDGNKNRQIFNSPETSFGQPFLGSTLKMESVMYGKGLSHFTEVEGNAKYKLLTEEAQRKALKSATDITSDITDTVAFFTAYESYMAIYLNAISRKNYAQSYNSIADYNYNSVDISQGQRQRKVDVSRYLIPGVQSIDGDKINNFQRESSVFVKTISPLPYPDQTPGMTANNIHESSRKTISSSGSCSSPSRLNDINVVSYYASLKNEIVNLWGQVYSYNTVDTGYQCLFGNNTPDTIFGGDTFIGRFAFKTKLPFFIDNRVNAPDDSDVYYDETGNIAYPKYWHSSRSITKNYSVPGLGVLPNMISYKAHNFDCPNTYNLASTPSEEESAGEKELMFYNGYYYLFAYGIPSFYCESSYNLDLRQAFNSREGEFWPHVSSSIPDDWVQENFVSIAQDNTYYYNTSFSKQNRENTFTHLPNDWDSVCYKDYPFRAIYSDPQYTGADNRVNSWLVYKPISYFDFPQTYGKLTSLDGIQNKAILARFENKTLLYNNLLTLDTSNPQAAYMGNPKLFDASPPIDFADTDLGYVGSQNKMILKLPQGQIIADAKRGQVFLIRGTEIVDITGFGSGVNRFFTDHLAFEILRFFPDVNTDNHFTSIGLHGVYDTKYDRVIITKLDYIPLDENIIYDNESNKFFIENEEVFLEDSAYFSNRSWTLSYNLNTNSWISFHSYIPNYYIGENNFFYSGVNSCCQDFDFIVGTAEDPCLFTGSCHGVATTEACKFVVISTTVPQPSVTCRFTIEQTSEKCKFSLSATLLPPTPEGCIFTATSVTMPPVASTCIFIPQPLCSLSVDILDVVLPTTTTTSSSTSTTTSSTSTTTTSSSTTTTSTTIPYCQVYKYSITLFGCQDCGQTGTGVINTLETLSVGKYYFLPNPGFKIRVDAFTGCGSVADTVLEDETKMDTCADVICITTTTTSTTMPPPLDCNFEVDRIIYTPGTPTQPCENCPEGYTPTIGGCVQYEETPPTYYPGNYTILKSAPSVAYTNFGTLVFDSWLENGTGEFEKVPSSNLFWNNLPYLSLNGPMNRSSVWASTTVSNQDIGFSFCIDTLVAKKYYVGFGADNTGKMKINGQWVLQQDQEALKTMLASSQLADQMGHKWWYIYAMNLPAGRNIIEVFGHNNTVVAAVGVQIYDLSKSQLMAATSNSDLGTGLLFSSETLVGQALMYEYSASGGYHGYTCPDGYALDTCSGEPRCMGIDNLPCPDTTTTTSSSTTTTTTTLNPSLLYHVEMEVNYPDFDPLTEVSVPYLIGTTNVLTPVKAGYNFLFFSIPYNRSFVIRDSMNADITSLFDYVDDDVREGFVPNKIWKKRQVYNSNAVVPFSLTLLP